MSLNVARWVNHSWVMNPYDMTCEQLLKLNTREQYERKDDLDGFGSNFDHPYFDIWCTFYKWGWIREEIDYRKQGYNHEILIHYSCPSSYSKAKRIQWLQDRGYPKD